MSERTGRTIWDFITENKGLSFLLAVATIICIIILLRSWKISEFSTPIFSWKGEPERESRDTILENFISSCAIRDTLSAKVKVIDTLKNIDSLDDDDTLILGALREKFVLYLDSRLKCDEIRTSIISKELQHLYDIQKKYQQ